MTRFAVLTITIWALGGCHAPDRSVELSDQHFEVRGPEEYDALFDACLDSLRDRDFRIDRADRCGGVITTFPNTGQHFFEFWRRDVETNSDALEATMLTIRRRVKIQLQGDPQSTQRQLAVGVYREKYATPDRQYNSSASALRVFSRTLPSTSGKRLDASDDSWVPHGRDAVLEKCLTEEIAARVATSLPAVQPADTPLTSAAPG
ncbi:MAG: hypothetical protein GY842_27120 [bacterium]|nr:hypothetical protein [bacterium]